MNPSAYILMRCIFLCLAALIVHSDPVSAHSMNRSVLPPPVPEFKGAIGETYKNSTPDWPSALPLRAPEGAPNILVILLNDGGFGQLGAYDGPIETPNIDTLPASGLRFVDFHTTAFCSPSRGTLLTGRNHHAIGLAAITEAATGFPGNYGNVPKSAATVAEVLKQNGRFSATETLDIGMDLGSPATPAYRAQSPFAFTGTIKQVMVETAPTQPLKNSNP